MADQRVNSPGTGGRQDKSKGLYDLNRDSSNPGKRPEAAEETLQAEPSDRAGNGSQDRAPGKGRRAGNGKKDDSLRDAEQQKLSRDDMPTGRERDHDFSKDDGAELKRMRGDGKLDRP